MRQAIEEIPGDLQQRQRFKEEIEGYLSWVEKQANEEAYKDIYVTDHKPKQKKYHTTNKAEDEEFYKYSQALEEYNNTSSFVARPDKTERFPRGSMLQKALDPFAGSQRLENGALYREVLHSELNPSINDEEKLRAEYARLKDLGEQSIEASEDNIDEFRLTMLQEMEQNSPFSVDEFEKILD